MKKYIKSTRVITVYDDERQLEMVKIFETCVEHIIDIFQSDTKERSYFLGDFDRPSFSAVYETIKNSFNKAGFIIGKNKDISGIGNNHKYAIYSEFTDGNTVEERVCGFMYMTIDPYGPLYVGCTDNKDEAISESYKISIPIRIIK